MTHDVCERASFGRTLFYNFTMPVSADDQHDWKITYTSQERSFKRQKKVSQSASLDAPYSMRYATHMN